MKNNGFILIRHSYDNHSYIDGKNDTELTEKGLRIANNVAKKVIYDISSTKVRIRYSTKLRAKQTAEIIGEYLMKNNIYCSIESDYSLTELYQGNFNFSNLTHQERIDFLQSCWDEFEYYRLRGNLDYRFGENKNSDIIRKLGENHREWSIRIANGVLNIINDLEEAYNSINISHRGAILEIMNIIKMANNEINFDDIEKYKTIWMEYCKNYFIKIQDLTHAKKKINQYISLRKNILE